MCRIDWPVALWLRSSWNDVINTPRPSCLLLLERPCRARAHRLVISTKFAAYLHHHRVFDQMKHNEL
ncbi:Hypothetical predicted protein [Cloeon dipterum]|uniref:Uncharacterized protein n=1 Tax=Cloeon dipterum TaxID=197152 RepID=A0A8S1C8F5_9INSE|nr:Hypothetical predicted protein [Cloeon dipterum]